MQCPGEEQEVVGEKVKTPRRATGLKAPGPRTFKQTGVIYRWAQSRCRAQRVRGYGRWNAAPQSHSWSLRSGD